MIKKIKFKEEVKVWKGPPAHWRYNSDGSESDETYDSKDLAEIVMVQNILRLVESTDAHFQDVTSAGFRFLLGCKQYFYRPENDGLNLTNVIGGPISFIRIVGLYGGSSPHSITDDEGYIDNEELIKDVVEINKKNFLIGDDAILGREKKPVRINIEREYKKCEDQATFAGFINHPQHEVSIEYDMEGRKKAFMYYEDSITCREYKKEQEKKNADTNNTGS